MFTVVYLHGFASSPASEKARFFSRYFASYGIKCAVPDLNAPQFSAITLTRIIAAAEQAAGERACVIGSSLGGYAAALWAAQREAAHRPLLAGMLIAPAFAAHQLWQGRLTDAQLAAWRTSGSLDISRQYGAHYPRLGFSLFEDALMHDGKPLHPRLPLLVFHGEADETVPVARSMAFAAEHPNVTLQTFAGEGHGLAGHVQLMAAKTLAFFTQAAYATAE